MRVDTKGHICIHNCELGQQGFEVPTEAEAVGCTA